MSMSVREAATESLEKKIRTGEILEMSVGELEAAEVRVKEWKTEVAKARRSALAAGWTERELKRLGLAGGRDSNRSKSAPAQPASGDTGGN